MPYKDRHERHKRGLCRDCSNLLGADKWFCDVHVVKNRQYMQTVRKRYEDKKRCNGCGAPLDDESKRKCVNCSLGLNRSRVNLLIFNRGNHGTDNQENTN